MKSSCRLEYIDVAKGIGILLIVWGHVSSSWLSWGWGCEWASYFKISLFFVISGYLQFLSKKIFTSFTRQKRC